jgi:hypothetical protein
MIDFFIIDSYTVSGRMSTSQVLIYYILQFSTTKVAVNETRPHARICCVLGSSLCRSGRLDPSYKVSIGVLYFL